MVYLIELLDEAKEFLKDEVEKSTKLKFSKVFRKVQCGHNRGDHFKKLSGTKNLYEFRVKDNGAWYRILAFMIHFEGDERATIVATHGFKKKTNKLPQLEIDKAEKTKRDY